MKTLIFACTTLICIVSSSFIKNDTGRKTYYYFCTSSVLGSKTAKFGNTFTYTGIHKLKGNETFIKERTKAWADYVRRNCLNSNDCSSDLNCYDTKEKAKKVYNEILKDYSAKGEYILKKVNF